jgi:hypothetical protein
VSGPLSVRVELKARRLLAEGRVRVLEAGYGRPGRAVVQGDHGVYAVSFGAGRVSCGCPSWKPCSHKRAVSLVVEAEA